MKKIRLSIRAAALLCASVLLLPALLCACGGNGSEDSVKLSFRDASTIDYLRSLDGKTVSINGYMASSSPVDGSFIFLMNLPYQSCPFCVPNTSQLANTIEVYPARGDSFDMSNQAITVTGTLVVAAPGAAPFTDPYGYEFYYKIVDAEYRIIDAGELSARYALWQRIAADGIVGDLYSMFDYVYFLCAWPEYYVNTYTGSDGQTHPGFYLYPKDALDFIKQDGAQYSYGYADGYFDRLLSRLRKLDEKELAGIIETVSGAAGLAAEALAELENGRYTSEFRHVDMFGTDDYVFTLDRGAELVSRFDELYSAFSAWIDSWEI
jgi:hypothetical protein